MGKVVAEALGGELDVVLVHKLGAPGNPELAVGAVSENGEVFTNENARALDISRDYIEREAQKQLQVLQARREQYTPDRGPVSPTGRTAIVVDDGVATGSTMVAALRTVREADPDRLIVAIAVAPADTVTALREEADEVVCLKVPQSFVAVGQAFREFDPVTDEEAIAVLQSARGTA
jgi:predicted phosphoribosyltransferase